MLSTRRSAAALGAAALLALSLSACTPADSDADNASASAANPELAATVEKLTQPLEAYPLPTDAVDGNGLKGKTIYYVPITLQSPQFAVTQKALTAAAEAVGASVQVCDGKGTPTDVASCVDQGTKAGAAAIIGDAVPYGLAKNAFDAALDAKIPVIITNQIASDDVPADATLGYIAAGGSGMQEALASWVSLNSGGKANVLINQSTDGPSPAQFVADGKKVYAADCADCTITVNEVSSANFSMIPSSTSSALLKDPNVNYVISQFEQYLQATTSGVQQASKTDSVKVLTGSAQLSGLKQLTDSGSLEAAAAQASAYQGWVDVDAALRLIAGQELPDYTIPVRLFDRDSIKDVTLTDEAEASGEWFGPTTFTDDFQKLWGLK
ncbi:MAG: substrate-binding domain-containing protein [Arthrobacter sp.]|jgi:ribose transport system substrate-binding protein|nr:substrate-binding domain-containing protein [Arthrobacter sp.]